MDTEKKTYADAVKEGLDTENDAIDASSTQENAGKTGAKDITVTNVDDGSKDGQQTSPDPLTDPKNGKDMNVATDQDTLGVTREEPDQHKLKVGFTCKNGWYELRPHGKLPEKRSHHCSVVHNDCIYIYGGEDNREGKYDTLWKLNLDAFIEIGNKGSAAEEDKQNEDIKTTNSPDNEDQEDDQRLQWELIKTTGTKPGAISYHKAVAKGDFMYLFGGMRADGECNGELYMLDLNTYEWTIDPTQQDRPEPRDDISMANSDHALYVYGGFEYGKRMNDLYSFTFETKTWE